jgi:hypothetical protein
LRESYTATITLDCKVTKVNYAGDEGGVMCHVAFDEEDKEEVFLVSITHLAFDRRLPVARKIAAYQKHRIKDLRRDGSTDAPAVCSRSARNTRCSIPRSNDHGTH